MNKTLLSINEHQLGVFNDISINESFLILKDCPIQTYKLLSWLQSDPNLPHEIDIDIESSFGKEELVISGGRIKGFDTDKSNVKSVVIGFNNIIRLNN